MPFSSWTFPTSAFRSATTRSRGRLGIPHDALLDLPGLRFASPVPSQRRCAASGRDRRKRGVRLPAAAVSFRATHEPDGSTRLPDHEAERRSSSASVRIGGLPSRDGADLECGGDVLPRHAFCSGTGAGDLRRHCAVRRQWPPDSADSFWGGRKLLLRAEPAELWVASYGTFRSPRHALPTALSRHVSLFTQYFYLNYVFDRHGSAGAGHAKGSRPAGCSSGPGAVGAAFTIARLDGGTWKEVCARRFPPAGLGAPLADRCAVPGRESPGPPSTRSCCRTGTVPRRPS